jgi:hypothetical protein
MRSARIASACLLVLVSTGAGAQGIPAHDACETATAVTSLPFTDVTSTTGAILDPDEPGSDCAPSISASVWYVVDAPADGELIVSTLGAGVDTVVDVFTGTCSALASLGCDDDVSGSSAQSRVIVPVTSGERLLIRVASYRETAPGPLVVSVVLGRPVHDDCRTPTDATALPFADEAITLGASAEFYEPVGGCGSSSQSVWYRVLPHTDGFLVADTRGSTYDTVLNAYVGTCGDLDLEEHALESVGCNDDTFGLQASLGVPVTASEPVVFQVSAYDYGEGGTLHFQVAWADPAPNDVCEDATTLPAVPFSVTQDVRGARREDFADAPCAPAAASVWYALTPASSGVLTIDTGASDYDTVLAAFGGPCAGRVPLACDDDTFGNRLSTVQLGVAAGRTVRLAVSAYGEHAAGGELVLNARLDPCATALDCNDGDVCTTDTCVDGACLLTPRVPCCRARAECDDGDVCTTDACVDETCVFTPRPSCCRDDTECDDGDGCTDDVCSAFDVCMAVPIAGCCAADAACDDASPCTLDRCLDAHCAHAPIDACCEDDGDCAAPDACSTVRCEAHQCATSAVAGCCTQDDECADDDPCTTDTCAANACRSTVPAGLATALCRLDEDPLTCSPESMPERLRRTLRRHIESAQAKRARAEGTSAARRTKRLLRRAERQVRRARGRIEQARRREKLTTTCADALREALAPPVLPPLLRPAVGKAPDPGL